MGGTSPSGKMKWNQAEVAKKFGLHRTTIAHMSKKLIKSRSPKSLVEKNSIDLARIDLIEHNKDRLLRELATRDLEKVRTTDLPKMVEQLAKAQSCRVEDALKRDMNLTTAELLKELTGKYKRQASNQVVDAEFIEIKGEQNDET